jgi:hypothetical protein
MPADAEAADLTLRLLADIPRLTLGAGVFPALLDHLAAAVPGERRAVCVLGEGETPRGEAHAALARSLAAHNPQIEQRLAQDLLARLRDGGQAPAAFDRDRLVVEEKPGKTLVLSLGEATIKAALKRQQALASRPAEGGTRLPVDAPDGWGVAACIISGLAPGASPPRGARAVHLASLDVQLAGEAIDLDTGRRLAAIAAAWLQATAGFGLQELKRVTLSVPWMAVAATVGAAFGPAANQRFPDLVHGWQPFLSLIELLYERELPALFVYTGRHPEVHLAAIWQ